MKVNVDSVGMTKKNNQKIYAKALKTSKDIRKRMESTDFVVIYPNYLVNKGVKCIHRLQESQ